MLNFLFKRATLLRSPEDVNTYYLCVGKKRYIFYNGKYTGWYTP